MSQLIIRALCLFLGGVVLCTQVSAQKSPYTYRRDRLGKFNLGMTMGIARNTYRAGFAPNLVDPNDPFGDTLRSVDLEPLPGLMLGVISNLNVADFLSLRLVPHFTFEQRNFTFMYFNQGKAVLRQKAIESSYFNVPLTAQWRTPYYKRHRTIVSTGVQIGWNMISDKKVRNDYNLLKVKSQDISLTLGAGIILYGDRIKMTPEIRYTAGISNIYEPEFTHHGSSIRYLASQTLTFCINFE